MKHKGGSWYARRRKRNDLRRAAAATLAFYASLIAVAVVALTADNVPTTVEAAAELVVPVAHAYTPPDPCGLKEVICEGEEMPPLVYVNESVEDMIRRKAAEYGVDAEHALAVVQCESHFNPNAVNQQGSTASGLWQFTEGTWHDGNRWRGTAWTLNDRFDAEKSTDMALWFIAREGWSRWACDAIVR